ncbi:Lrp/AsnC family transcriptional regulator [Candidatus Woesearchaeota archaeon]|jgi:DNA-binding Lrp family transcriptional regulator|nr:Lrp/AsnC family transcriptional regulator [Candidatus Woesearchaeota archaeon]
MDKINQKIIQELDKNPKVPLTKLSKKLRISQQVADYRIKRMIESGQIKKFGTIINLNSLKQEHYRIFFTFSNKYSNKEIFSYLKKQKGIYWTARVGGRYDLLIVLFVFNFQIHDSFIDALNTKFPGLIKEYSSNYGTDYFLYKHKYFNKDDVIIHYSCNDQRIDVDKLDLEIIKEIKDNCRMSSVELGKKYAVSYKTILNRIKSLEQKKIILGYRLFLESPKLKSFTVLFSFQNYSRSEEKSLINYIAQIPTITQAIKLYGQWGLNLQIKANNNEELQNILIDLKNKFSILNSHEIIPIFEDIEINLCPI